MAPSIRARAGPKEHLLIFRRYGAPRLRALLVIALVALASCADFADAELEYCLEHPGVCPTFPRDAGARPDGGDGGN